MSSGKQITYANERIQVFVKTYRGKPKIYIRRHYDDPLKGRICSTKILSTNEWKELNNSSQMIDKGIAAVCEPQPMVAVNRTSRGTTHRCKLHPDVQSKEVNQHYSGLSEALQVQGSNYTSDIKNYDNCSHNNFENEKVSAVSELLKLLNGPEFNLEQLK